MKMKRHRQPLEIMASMNITNLLDTAFILLITFMVIAPQLNHSIEIKLPEVDNPPQTDIDEKHSLLIVIQEKDPNEPEERIYIEGDRVTLDQMLEIIQEKKALDPELAVNIEGDQKMSFGMFMQVHAKLSEAKIEVSNIIVRPKPSNP